MSLKGIGSRRPIHPRRIRSFSKASTTGSDDSDSEEDENERRKYISLKGGQCILWSANKFGNNWDLTQDKYFNEYTNDVSLDKSPKSSFKRNIDGRHSLRHLRSNRPLNLDNIQINSEFEYGFNPKRPTGSKANNSVKLRPLSLYSPPSQRQKIVLKSAFSDASEKFTKKMVNGYNHENFLQRTVSYARNDYEAQLEKKVLSLRAQPCNLRFQGSKGILNEEELAEDMANARRRRFVRRQLSFDSHPRKKWKKTVSLDSGLATESWKSLKSRSFNIKDDNASKSEEILDSDVSKTTNDNIKERSSKSVEFLDIISNKSPRDQIDADSESTMCASDADTLILSSYENDIQPVKIMPPPVMSEEKSLQIDLLLSTSDKHSKPSEKTKRKTSFPQILSAFRLPNKRTFQRFIQKKKSSTTYNVSPEVNSNSDVIPNGEISPTYTVIKAPEIPVPLRSLSTQSVNTYEEPAVDIEGSKEQLLFDRSCSQYSLPRVDEEKESFEFSSPLERRSKSSCSISFTKTHLRPNQDSTLQRRMSDTVLSSHEKTIGCSPGRKFVRRLLSPVVCGLPSPDRYGLLNDSMQSLASYDSTSITSDSDISYPQLFDFGSQELAEEMTLIDKELLVRISWEELSILGWMSSDKVSLAPNIMKMVQFFNRLAMLVSTSVLLEETTYRRAKIIRKAIKLAWRCRIAKNYNSLKAVLGGLQCTPIFRLKATWKQVPSRYRRMFRELSELMSENNNFSIYRQELSTAIRNPPCIPFLGNFLTQVAHTHAYMAVHVKYKANSFIINDKENDDIVNTTLTNREQENNDVNNYLSGPVSSEGTAHTRSDSDDSGVVLSLHRLSSHASDDCEPSPQSCMNSPEEETRKFEDVFNKPEVALENCNHIPNHCRTNSSPLDVKNRVSPSQLRKSTSVDNGDIRRRQFSDITNIINSRPVARGEDEDDLYECEVMFWKYQISAVQFNIIPRSYIRRYLMNSPYNTEEENYKLSLKREPPARTF